MALLLQNRLDYTVKLPISLLYIFQLSFCYNKTFETHLSISIEISLYQ